MMNIIKTAWNALLACTVFETFKESAMFKKYLLLLLEKLMFIIDYIIDKLK